jgi:hypothetical protein
MPVEATLEARLATLERLLEAALRDQAAALAAIHKRLEALVRALEAARAPLEPPRCARRRRRRDQV